MSARKKRLAPDPPPKGVKTPLSDSVTHFKDTSSKGLAVKKSSEREKSDTRTKSSKIPDFESHQSVTPVRSDPKCGSDSLQKQSDSSLLVRPKWTTELDLRRPSPDLSQGSSVGHDSGVASDIDSKKFSDSSSSSSRSSSTSYEEGDETDSLSGSSSTSSDNETSSSVVTSDTSVNKSRRESLSRLEEIKAIRGTLKKTKKPEFQCYEGQEGDGGGTTGRGEDFLVCRTPPIISQDVTTFFLDENSDCLSDSPSTKGQFPPLTFMSVASTETDVSSMPSGSFAGIKLALGFDFDRHSNDPSCQLTGLLSTGGGIFKPGMEPGSSSEAVTRGNTIRSDRGTVRGVRNRVRAGIATFQLKDSIQKTYAENERGRVVVYVTSLGVVREMLANCIKVRQIMRNLLVKIVEKDIFMSRGHQSELRERMETLRTMGGAVVGRSPTSNLNSKTNSNSNCLAEESVLLSVPQVFVEGQYLGNADAIERLNEAGELRKMLRPFKCPSVTSVCRSCGGFGLLPCTVCNGSKKSVLYRNDFTQKFVALRCTACDESALVQCQSCNSLP